MDLCKQVFASLDNARDNGYDVHNWSPTDLAADLIECDADLENCTVEELLPHIEAWLQQAKE